MSQRQYPYPENLLRRLMFMPNGCIEFTGSKARGYGKLNMNGRLHLTHRLAYEMVRGPIPDGLQIDHLCRNPPCCNPAHLEPVTPAENHRRGLLHKTQCKNGHDLTPDNVYVRPDRGSKVCRTCLRAEWQVVNDRRAEQKRAAA